MGVELYFVKPDARGRIVFPFWDEQGNDVAGIEHECISSLKWAMGDPRLGSYGLISADAIEPARLVRGAGQALKGLLAELAILHPDFQALADLAGDDPGQIRELLYAFEAEQDWVGGDAAARARAFAAARASSPVHELLRRILKAGQQGFFGCWSY